MQSTYNINIGRINIYIYYIHYTITTHTHTDRHPLSHLHVQHVVLTHVQVQQRLRQVPAAVPVEQNVHGLLGRQTVHRYQGRLQLAHSSQIGLDATAHTDTQYTHMLSIQPGLQLHSIDSICY